MPDLPEFYVDAFTFTVTPFGSTMTFGLNVAHPSPGQPSNAQDVVRLRMSLEHAKIMTMLIKRQLKNFEEQAGAAITIPRQVYNGAGLSQEDW